MTLDGCAAIVERGDPDRFAAAMASPPAARRVLFPLYAFNIEVARAPQVASEPLIGEMRLQWWRDALEEVAAGRAVRRHEVTVPLALVLDPQAARDLDGLVAARRADLERAPFADLDALVAYLDGTGGALMWTAARLLGAPPPASIPVRALARAAAAASYLVAIPRLLEAGREALPEGFGPGDLARVGVEALRAGRRDLARVPRPARAALLTGWQAAPILHRAVREPEAVTAGRLLPSEFARRLRLIGAAATGRI